MWLSLSPSAGSTSLRLQPTRRAFFHFSSHVRPRFIWVFNQNVIFTMLVCESEGSRERAFFWCFESHVCSAGIVRQLAPTPIPQTPRRQLSDLLASFYWEGKRENERNISKNNSVIEPVCSVAQHKGKAGGVILMGLGFMANYSEELLLSKRISCILSKHVLIPVISIFTRLLCHY